ncbi:MAG: hypothetical protein QM612_02720 [Thermomonas sp.]|uniref:hypothetical protein n=1 Tax=Thermomonas sp. TaxID=1971895 RepID=UPI0039E5C7BC
MNTSRMHLRTSIIATALTGTLLCGAADAQSLGDMFKRAAKDAVREAVQKSESKARDAGIQEQRSQQSEAPSSDKGYLAPRRETSLGNVPQHLILAPAVGRKFTPATGKPQVIAVNPYLQPDAMFFTGMGGLQCPAEGGLIVAGDAGLNEKGNTIGEGYWRIAEDGAISPLLSRRYKDSGVRSNAPMLPANPPDKSWADGNLPSPGYSYYRVDGFGLGRNGDILLGASDVVVRIARDGRVRRVAGKAGEQGFADGAGGAARFKSPGRPVEDDQGNLWLADQDNCAIRKITPDGTVSTLMGPDRLCNAAQVKAEDQIVPDNMLWDTQRGELVVGGHFIRAKPHDLYHTVWRIRPDGQARRVLHARKNSGTLLLDGIYSMALDAQGRLYLGVGRPGRNRSIARVDDAGKTTFLTGTAYTGFAPGNEAYPVDGTASGSNFRLNDDMCFATDGKLYVIDYHLLRRYDPVAGTVRTWAY